MVIAPVGTDDGRLALPQRRGTPAVLVDSRSRARGQCVARRSSQARLGPAG